MSELDFLVENFDTYLFDEEGFHHITKETAMAEGDNAMLDTISNAFEAAKNAIAERSTLATRVAQLEGTMSNFKEQMDKVSNDVQVWKDRYEMLQTHHQRVLKERDEAQMQRDQAEDKLVEAHNLRVKTEQDLEITNNALTHANANLDQAQKDRDEAIMRQLKIEEEHKALLAKHQRIVDALGLSERPLEAPSTSTSSSDVEDQEGPLPSSSLGEAESGFRWPSSLQPRDPQTQQFRSYPKTGTDED